MKIYFLKKIKSDTVILFFITVFSFAQNSTLKNLEIKFDSLNYTDRIQILEKIKPNALTSIDKANYFYLFGKTYYSEGKGGKTLSYYMKALELYKANKEQKKSIDLSLAIAEIKSLSDYPYNVYKLDLENAITIAKETNDDELLSKTYKTIGSAIFEKNTVEAIRYYNLAKESNKKRNDLLFEARVNSNIGLAYSEYLNDLKLARHYYTISQNYFLKTKNNFQIACGYINYSAILLKEKKMDSAVFYYKKADAIDVKEYRNNFKIRLYELLSDTYKDLKDYKNALEYIEKKSVFQNYIDENEQLKAVKEIDVKYKTKEKTLLISSLKNNLLSSLITLGVLIIIVFVIFLGYQNQKKKKLIAEQGKQLEAEKLDNYLKNQELHEIDILLEGQEKERIKIANDLHDNLGNLMATLKINVYQLREYLKPTNQDQIKLIQQVEELIDTSYEQIRTIAHTKNAGVIAKEGLLASILNITTKITNKDTLTVEVIPFGMNERFENTLEITIFRMVQEALTNILKYAQASHIAIYLTRHDLNLSIIIEDNGIGFDPNKMQNEGMGLTHIAKKVEELGGTFTIDSRLGRGTNLLIDIPI